MKNRQILKAHVTKVINAFNKECANSISFECQYAMLHRFIFKKLPF